MKFYASLLAGMLTLIVMLNLAIEGTIHDDVWAQRLAGGFSALFCLLVWMRPSR